MSKPAISRARGSPLGSADGERATAHAVQGLFASITPRYDLLNHCLSLGFDILWRRAAARTLEETLVKPGSRVADLCCGTGDLAIALGKLSGGKVVGADFCHPMLEKAGAKSRKRRLPVEFVEADSLELPFAEESLDGVATAFGFRNLANYARGLREMRRVLKPGGKIAILEFSQVRWPVFGALFRFYFRNVLPRLGDLISGVRGPYRYLRDSVTMFPDQEKLAALMREEGFANVQYRNFTGGVAALHTGQKA
jgi:demethylmenaquinone methyltransferase / 2-methoxy-6-polyprenyl-1,4-benzoquinol methylase